METVVFIARADLGGLGMIQLKIDTVCIGAILL